MRMNKMGNIFVATYDTESGDHGVIGYWTEQPTEEQLTALFKEWMPDEFVEDEDGECRYVFWELIELEHGELPEGIAQIPTI